MSILEILEAHRVSAFAGSDTACACDRTWRSNADYRAHVAQVLEQHEREAKAAALKEAADEIEAKAERLSPDDSFQQGARIGIITSAVDLQTRAAQLKETP